MSVAKEPPTLEAKLARLKASVRALAESDPLWAEQTRTVIRTLEAEVEDILRDRPRNGPDLGIDAAEADGAITAAEALALDTAEAQDTPEDFTIGETG
jgi:hypothetical protein